AYSIALATAAATIGEGEALRPGRRAQADLLRCIFGNPFRVVPFNSAWKVPEIARLARAAYDARLLPAGHLDPAHLEVLAGPLEEAGGTDEPALRHLRGFAWCLRCEGTGRSPYDLGYAPPPREPCPDCGASGWLKTEAPHVRGCWVIDMLIDSRDSEVP